MTVTLIRGLPGSGKSTYAKKLNCLHIEADMYFMHDGKYEWNPSKENHTWCQSMAFVAMKCGMDVCISNTFTTVKEMQPYLVLAKVLKANVRVVRMTGDYGNTHEVPEETLNEMRERWEPYDGEEVIGESPVSASPVLGDVIAESEKVDATTNKKTKNPLTDAEIIALMDKSPYVIKKPLKDADGNPTGVVSYNYSREAAFKCKWDDATIHARGLFIRDGKILARSFDKFFRINENKLSSIDRIYGLLEKADMKISIEQKYNGYLGICAWDEQKNDWFIASHTTDRGAYAEYFAKRLRESRVFKEMEKIAPERRAGHSFVFEVLDDELDPHIVHKYRTLLKDDEFVVLLGVFRNSFTDYEIKNLHEEFGDTEIELYMDSGRCIRVKDKDDFVSLMEYKLEMSIEIEGHVAKIKQADGSFYRFKVKSSYYSFWKYVRGELNKWLKKDPTMFSHPNIKFYKGNESEYVYHEDWMDDAVSFINTMTRCEIETFKTKTLLGDERLNMLKLSDYVTWEVY